MRVHPAAGACFLVLCLSPRLFDQGSQWFTPRYLQQALTGSTAVAIVNSLWVSPERRDLSMVFQDYALWPHLTALDNVAFALRRRRLPRVQCRSRALVMLSRVGLEEFARLDPDGCHVFPAGPAAAPAPPATLPAAAPAG